MSTPQPRPATDDAAWAATARAALASDDAAFAARFDAGEDIDYDGVSGPVDLGDTGSPTKATIGIFVYDATNTFHNLKYVTGVI